MKELEYRHIHTYPLSTQIFFLGKASKHTILRVLTAFHAQVAWKLKSPTKPTVPITLFTNTVLVQLFKLRMCLVFYIGILPPYLATASPCKDSLVCCNSSTIMEPSWDHANSLYSCKFDAYIDLSHKQPQIYLQNYFSLLLYFGL